MDNALSAPQPLHPSRLLDAFDCGEPTLDDWLKRRARTNEATGASRTFVVAGSDLRVLAYYALATGAVTHQEATGAVRRNMPNPVPVIVVGRLAIDRNFQGRKLGPALLQDALSRTRSVAQNVGVRAVLVHALHERAKTFYEHYGFKPSPIHPLTLMLPL